MKLNQTFSDQEKCEAPKIKFLDLVLYKILALETNSEPEDVKKKIHDI